MAISLYSGTPGSYKSFHAVKESLEWLRRGKNLITNFPLNYKNKLRRPIKGVYECVNNIDLTVDYLINFACEHHHPGLNAQTLLVVDEASIKFNSRDFNMKDRMGWINFFANHRHFNYDVILVTQSDIMIDKQIRQLIEHEYKHRAITNFKFIGRFLSLIFHGLHLYIDIWYPMQLHDKTHWCFFNKRIADCYDTMGLFVGSKSMDKLQFKSQSLNKLKGGETISNVKSFKKKQQVKNDLTKFVNLLNTYVLYLS